MLPLTKPAVEVFAPTDTQGHPRGPDNGEVQTWGIEMENIVVETLDVVDTAIEELQTEINDRLYAIESVPEKLLDVARDNNLDLSSNVALQEVLAEYFDFVTPEANCEVRITVTIPLVVYTASDSGVHRNGACRVYLDGTAFNDFPSGARQWNGLVITNAGQWCHIQNTPVDTLVSTSIRMTIPSAGSHRLRIHVAGSTTDTVISLHGRRRYQVELVKAARGDRGPSGAGNLSIMRAVSTGDIAVAADLIPGYEIDGVVLVADDVVLVAGQSDATENGVYVVQSSGDPVRHADFATFNDYPGKYFSVMEGDVNKSTLWRCTSPTGGVIGTTPILFGRVREERDMLTANRTYYVRTDGSDSDDGLTNTTGGAFATIQRAIDIAASIDLGSYNVTISVGAGTFADPIVAKDYLGAGFITIAGAGAATVISTTSNSCFSAAGTRRYVLKDAKLQTTTSGNGITATAGAVVEYEGIEFGACAGIHVFASSNSAVTQRGACTVTGGAGSHLWADSGARLNVATQTIALSGTPAFSTAFAQATLGASISAILASITGSATGVRFNAANGGVITTSGGGASFFPGNATGTGTNFGASPWGLYI